MYVKWRSIIYSVNGSHFACLLCKWFSLCMFALQKILTLFQCFFAYTILFVSAFFSMPLCILLCFCTFTQQMVLILLEHKKYVFVFKTITCLFSSYMFYKGYQLDFSMITLQMLFSSIHNMAFKCCTHCFSSFVLQILHTSLLHICSANLTSFVGRFCTTNGIFFFVVMHWKCVPHYLRL